MVGKKINHKNLKTLRLKPILEYSLGYFIFLIFLISLIVYLLWGCSAPPITVNSKESFCLSDSMKKMIEIDKVELRPVYHELKLNGKITFNEEKVAKVFPMVGGTVTSVSVELGDPVRKGQVLAIIKSSQVAEFEQQLSAAQTNLSLAEKNLDVLEDLYKSGLAAQKDLVGAQKEVEKAKAELNRVQEVFKIYNLGKGSDYTVLSPTDGYIVEKKITEGMQIRPDNTEHIFTVSGLNEVWVVADVYESDIAKVKEGYPVQITTISYPDKIFTGKIDKLFNVLDPETRVMKARIKLQNQDLLLKPEMYANIQVSYSEDRQMLAIPSRTIVFDKSRNYVMVYKDDCQIETRPVEINGVANGYAYVASGLKSGERAIGKYQLLVYDALND